MAASSVSLAVLVSFMLSSFVAAAPAPARRASSRTPFAPLDPQNWENPDNMTWADFVPQPGTNWSDPTRKGSIRNFNIALITVDYSDMPFVITLPANSTIFNNPQPIAGGVTREQVPNFYRDLLNTPNDLNNGHTLHEYWMGDSFGEYGVDLTVYGAYRLPSLSWQYGVDDEQGGMNPGACPGPGPCSVDLRTDALGAWRAEVGDEAADKYELVYILSAGQDESSTWQEFGEMKFASPEDVPDAFGPPGNSTLPDFAKTRYVNWTSWASASVIWPNAGGGSSTQAESSGMATFAHELSHLLGIGDNYNNPYATNPARRAYSGPFSMLDRGSFNGPGGPHTRWQIPPVQGASMGSYHTMRDKHHIRLITADNILQVSRAALAESGLVVAELTAREVKPGDGLIGVNVTLPKDLSPKCNTSADPLCDGGNYNAYNLEVIDRMGADSFVPDHGVMISKSKFGNASQPFQWVIDANPEDIHTIDFVRPDGTPKYYTVGDYRQLADALFHAGTNSGSEFEYTDEANRLHFYIIDINRDETGVLRYTIGIKSLDGSGLHKHKVQIGALTATAGATIEEGKLFSFELKNKGEYKASSAVHPQDLSAYLTSDIFRIEAEVEGGTGWKVQLPNALATAKYGESVGVDVAVMAAKTASKEAHIKVTVTSEGDAKLKQTKRFKVSR
jgi:M6 family metalloprotease-like protein